jgi:hypothetical protein
LHRASLSCMQRSAFRMTQSISYSPRRPLGYRRCDQARISERIRRSTCRACLPAATPGGPRVRLSSLEFGTCTEVALCARRRAHAHSETSEARKSGYGGLCCVRSSSARWCGRSRTKTKSSPWGLTPVPDDTREAATEPPTRRSRIRPVRVILPERNFLYAIVMFPAARRGEGRPRRSRAPKSAEN